MPRLLSLPEDKLKLVLQRVPLKDRLGSCCLVSKRLHAAAVAATDCLDLKDLPAEHAQSALSWLTHYGQYLTSLRMFRFPQPLQQLACPNLLELELALVDSVQLGPAADGSPGVIQGCTKLTRLEVLYRIIDAPAGGELSDSLSDLVHLQHLEVVHYPRGSLGLSGATLPCLQHLTYLEVERLSLENLLQLGGLTNLQELHLRADDGIAVGPNTVPGLLLPATLTKLELLSRVEAGMLSVVPTGLQHLLVDCVVEGPADGPGSFLSCMNKLQHLTQLELTEGTSGLDWAATGPAYSALTASSNLVDLYMVVTELPPGIWRYVFPSTHKLPHLTNLMLRDRDEDDPDDLGEAFASSPRWGAADLCSLVSCCPGLCSIDALALQPGLHVSELHKLTALTCLILWCYSNNIADVEESVKGLAAVTQLHFLRITTDVPHVTETSLFPLTSLTALASLECYWYNAVTKLDATIARIHTQDGFDSPDVWLQLLERCAADPGCQPTVLRSLAQQLGEQKALAARQQQQLSDQQQKNDAQQQQIGGLQQQVSDQQERMLAQQQQVAVLQERVSAQQQAAAQQGALIAGLQEQLQQLLLHGETGRT